MEYALVNIVMGDIADIGKYSQHSHIYSFKGAMLQKCSPVQINFIQHLGLKGHLTWFSWYLFRFRI